MLALYQGFPLPRRGGQLENDGPKGEQPMKTFQLTVLVAMVITIRAGAQTPEQKAKALAKVDAYKAVSRTTQVLAEELIEKLKVGDVFKFPSPILDVDVVRVVQVIDGDNALIVVDPSELDKLSRRNDRPAPLFLWLKGVPTKGWVDRRSPAGLDRKTVFEVAGTKRYTSVGGGARTVFLVQPIAGKPTEAEEELAATRQWELNEESKQRSLAAKAVQRERDRAEQEAKAKKAREAKDAAEAKRKAEAPAKAEKVAAAKLKLIEELAKVPSRRDTARWRLEQLLKEYPKTEAAKEAKKLLDSLK
jgi:hypothetical protein